MLAAQLLPAFVLGLLATASPCALPLYPGFLAYLAAGGAAGAGGSLAWLGLAVLGGVLVAMLVVGAVVVALSLALGSLLVVVTPLADVIVLGLGLGLLAGRRPFAGLPGLTSRAGGGPLRAAFLYGLLYGPVTLPCTGALAVSVFALSLGAETVLARLAFFLAFGLGLGAPLVAISLVAHRARGLVLGLARHEAALLRAAGVILVAVGAADLAQNLPSALHYLDARP